MKYIIGLSNIHGHGIIATDDIKQNEIIGIAIDHIIVSNKLVPYITDFGSWVNHCDNSNARLEFIGKYYLVANRFIRAGEEITGNYNTAPRFVPRAKIGYKQC